MGSAVLCESKCGIRVYWGYSIAEGSKNPFDEAGLFCQPSDEANRKGLLCCGEDGFGVNVCYTEVLGIPFALALCNYHC